MLFHNSKNPTELKTVHLNKSQQKRTKDLSETLTKHEAKTGLRKKLTQTVKKALTESNKKADKKNKSHNIFVLDFDGDVKASNVKHLREEISTVISVAKPDDEVVLRLESPGGMVHGYGLAAAQLVRIKDAGLKLTVCVDKMAASGGYMMACVADKIIAAPFAIVGSIGVIAQMPNFNKLLKKNDIDFEMFTAGDFKRTVTVFGENNDKNKQKFQEELEQTHVLFKDFVSKYRSHLDIATVATGEHWYGEDALKRQLIDELQTSDAYLLSAMEENQVYALYSQKKPTFAEKLGFAATAETVLTLAFDKLPDLMNKIEQNNKFLK